ncbi:MAG: MFS transporter, partial [Candidatus Auribacterota bacterium]|nr:MFS transporter [Candidatus Auribacterota bacterium]
IENQARKKPVLVGAITIRALCWALLALITYLFSFSHPWLVVVSLLFLVTLFTFMGGVAAIPFFDIWGKAIPSRLRGRFFGYRQLGGGALAILAGWVVKRILGDPRISFPNNYALLFLLSALFMGVSYIALGLVREPIEEVHPDRLPFRGFLGKSWTILKKDHNYRQFLLVQILMGTTGLSLPFYVLYARNILGIELEMVGLFLSAQMLGALVSNLIWGHLSDFVGSRAVIRGSAGVALLIPTVALLIPANLPWLFIGLFFLVGVFITGRTIGNTNFMLDIAPAKERPAYISLKGTLALPIVVCPLLGGIIAQNSSYVILFGITVLLTLGGFIFSFFLTEPRFSSDRPGSSDL